ncbi:MAG: hypothetical protein NTZ24_06315 [Deltaproteobacteria bacterium]|nr:hypothetical protein [Deltaproteobacteria bacterium]
MAILAFILLPPYRVAVILLSRRISGKSIPSGVRPASYRMCPALQTGNNAFAMEK